MEAPLTKYIKPSQPPLSLSEYKKVGGYDAVDKALKTMAPADITNLVKSANLLGRGGAGFPTGIKWGIVPIGNEAPHPRYVIANGDEMEPGTFKDRYLLEGNPHQLIAGMIISSFAVQADTAYIFIRWAYKEAAKIIQKAIDEAYAAGYLGKNILGTGYSLEMYLHTSAGRYICGEETALINSLEGKRAIPRAKPPFPANTGLFGKPTLVNNIETLSWITHIVANGADWFKSLSYTDEGGTKLFGVSGKVKKPGLWELPLGTTIRELLEDHAGGMQDGYKLQGILPGGASTDFLVESHLDAKLDFSSISALGSRLGTGNMIVMDDKTCPVKFIHNLINFFALESCGWCTPCREGLPWVTKILQSFEEGTANPGDMDILKFHTKYLAPGNTFCAHAPGAMEPLQSGIKYFYDDFMRHIQDKHCPWRNV